MKKIFKTIIGCVSVVLMAGVVLSCSKSIELPDAEDIIQETGLKTCSMTLDGGVSGFGQDGEQVLTKATSSAWEDGDLLYVTFYNGETIVSGTAIYSSSAGWSISYDGDLAGGTGLKCEVRHFVNATFANASLVTINTETEIYEDVDGSYEYDGTTLSVKAHMTPKTGRIRFKGTAEEVIHLTGISVYTTYAPALNKFSDIKSMIALTVGSDGYTPYVYGALANENKKLGLIGSDFAFTRTCTDEILKVGDSGYMTIPSENSHNKWSSGLYVSVGDVEFKMIAVAGHTDGFFLIGETEITRGLYNIVAGETSAANANNPKTGLSYSGFYTFVQNLNSQTQLAFSLPSKDQWLYASIGGNQSQGFTYSGSNNPRDVAWYEVNSEGKSHPVKQLAPNELGIFDMSGNVAELTSTNNGGSGYARYYYALGGHYNSTATSLTSTLSCNDAQGEIGARLMLTLN